VSFDIDVDVELSDIVKITTRESSHRTSVKTHCGEASERFLSVLSLNCVCCRCELVI
jgi:hypothetical protein